MLSGWREKVGNLGKMAKDLAQEVLVTDGSNSEQAQKNKRQQEELLTFDDDDGLKQRSAEKAKQQGAPIQKTTSSGSNEARLEGLYRELSSKYEETNRKLEEVTKKNAYLTKVLEEKNKEGAVKSSLEKERDALLNERDQRVIREDELQKKLLQSSAKLKELEAKFAAEQKTGAGLKNENAEIKRKLEHALEASKRLEEAGRSMEGDRLMSPINEKLNAILIENTKAFIQDIKQKIVNRLKEELTKEMESHDSDVDWKEIFNYVNFDESFDAWKEFSTEPETDDRINFQSLRKYFTSEEELLRLQNKAAQLEQDSDRLLGNIEQLTQERARDQEASQAKVDQMSKEIELSAANIISLEEAQGRLSLELGEKIQEAIKKDDLIKHMENTVLKKNSDLNQLMEEFNKEQKEKSEASKKIEELSNLKEELCGRIKKLEENLSNEREKLKLKETELERAMHENSKFDPAVLLHYKEIMVKEMLTLAESLEGGCDIQKEVGLFESEMKKTSDETELYEATQSFFSSARAAISRNISSNLKTWKDKNENLTKSFTQLQADCRDLNKREKDLLAMNAEIKKFSDDQQNKIEEMATSLNVRDNKIRDLQKNIAELQENKKNFVVELKTRLNEVEGFKSTIKAKDEEVESLKKLINRYETELKTIAELRAELERKDGEISGLKQTIEDHETVITSLQNGLHNFQVVHEESQQRNELLAKKYDNELKRIRGELEISQRKVESLSDYQSKCEEVLRQNGLLGQQVRDLEKKYRDSEQEKNDIKIETNALIKKIKNEALYKENLIDKRVISKFLISYFDSTTTYFVKLQILETLSSVLSFSEEERVKIGLHKKKLERHYGKSGSGEELKEDAANSGEKEEGKKTGPEGGENLKDKFMQFLMEDDEES